MGEISGKNIRKGSASYRILEYLWNYPEVQRKYISIANGNYSGEQASESE